jgi:hypothetical protein
MKWTTSRVPPYMIAIAVPVKDQMPSRKTVFDTEAEAVAAAVNYNQKVVRLAERINKELKESINAN